MQLHIFQRPLYDQVQPREQPTHQEWQSKVEHETLMHHDFAVS